MNLYPFRNEIQQLLSEGYTQSDTALILSKTFGKYVPVDALGYWMKANGITAVARYKSTANVRIDDRVKMFNDKR